MMKRFDASCIALCLAGSAGIFFGHPNPVGQLPLLILAVPYCLYLLGGRKGGWKAAFMRGWFLGLPGFCGGLYWIVVPVHNVGGLPYPLALPCVVLLAAYLSCYTGLFCVAARNLRLLFAPPDEQSAPTAAAALLPPLLAGLAYGGIEAASGVLFTGFPWLPLSTAFAPWICWIQAASLVGAYGLSGILAMGACFCAAAAELAGGRRIVSFLAGLYVIATVPFYGYSHLSVISPDQGKKPLSVLMVQGNIDQNQKWDPSFQQSTIDRYMALTDKGLAEAAAEKPPRKIDLVLWPETAMPFYYQSDAAYAGQLRAYAARKGVNLAFGTLGFTRTRGRVSLYNRLQLVSWQGRDAGYYDKRHLVPFGEYLPGVVSFEFLRNILQNMDFSAGAGFEPLRVPLPPAPPDPLADAPMPPLLNGEPQVVTPGDLAPSGTLALGVLICYEGIFPELAQDRVSAGADILVNVSNDAWFGFTSAPAQHLALTAMRAVEQSRPIVRATNTGYTAVIDAAGKATVFGKLFTEAAFAVNVTPMSGQTLYHKLHPVPEAVMAAFALLALFGCLLRKKPRQDSHASTR